MNKFEYKGKAEIKHLNVRKEGGDDDKVLAIDVRFTCTTDAEILDFFHEGMREVLFTDIGAVKNSLLKPLSFANTIVNCDLEIIGKHYGAVDVQKISIEPKDGNKVAMTFSVSIQPTGTEIAQLSEFVMDEIDIDIRPQPQLDFSGNATSIEGAQEALTNLKNLTEKRW